MTGSDADVETEPATGARHRTRGTGSSGRPWLVASILVGLTAGLVRAFQIGSTYDLFVDERVYERLGHSVLQAGFPRLQDGSLFFFHPPGFFYLEAGWTHLLGQRADLVSAIYQQRYLNCVLAGLTATVLLLLTLRVAGRVASLVVTAIFALEPYVLRQNGRVLLETSTMFFVLLGYLVLVPLTAPGARRPLIRAAGGGLLFGIAILNKDLALPITVGPLLIALALRWMPRRQALLATTTAILPYLVYLAVLAQQSHFGAFFTSKTTGVRRLLGLVQSSGFNKAGAPTLGGQLISQAPTFGSTYALLVLGVGALVVVALKGSSTLRFLGAFHAFSGAVLLYAALFGTNEEQFLYLLALPNLITLAAAATLISHRMRTRPRRRRALLTATVVVLLGLLGLELTNYAIYHVHPDDGYARLRTYMKGHVPVGASVIVPNGGTDLLLNDLYRTGSWTTPSERRANNATWLAVPRKSVQQGYAYLSLATIDQLESTGTRVFSFTDRTYGEVSLYQLPLPAAPR